MTLKQLRSVCAIVDHGLRISQAADATFRSQPSVTRQIRDLERELGFAIFIRNRNKVLAVTPQGSNLIAAARRMLREEAAIRQMGKEIANASEGELNIATTHTHACYTLPPIIDRFMQEYPLVQLTLRQGTPRQCCELVASGKADLAISSRIEDPPQEISFIPCYRTSRSVITPRGHPLLRAKPLTLEALARYPLIGYDEAYSASQVVLDAFIERGLTPRVILSAIDADVCKIYVARKLGIAILSSIAFDPKRDKDLCRIPAGALFKPIVLHVVVPRHGYIRQYMYDFMYMFAPHLRKATIEGLLSPKRRAAQTADHLPLL